MAMAASSTRDRLESRPVRPLTDGVATGSVVSVSGTKAVASATVVSVIPDVASAVVPEVVDPGVVVSEVVFFGANFIAGCPFGRCMWLIVDA
jgi:hypothetical protein